MGCLELEDFYCELVLYVQTNMHVDYLLLHCPIAMELTGYCICSIWS